MPAPGSFAWENPNNWDPAGEPMASDGIFVNNGGFVLTPADDLASAGRLYISHGSVVQVSAGGLDVQVETVLASNPLAPSRLTVSGTGTSQTIFRPAYLSVEDSTVFTVQNARTLIEINLALHEGGRVEGNGLVQFGSFGGGLSALGRIRTSAGDLTLQGLNNATAAFAFSSELHADGGDLTIDADIDGDFQGHIIIDEDRTVQLTDSVWVNDGTIEFNGDGGVASYAGGRIAHARALRVNSGTASIDARLRAQEGSQVFVEPNAVLLVSEPMAGADSAGGHFSLSGGQIIAPELLLTSTGKIIGHGSLTVNRLTNFGSISVSGGDLVIDAVDPPALGDAVALGGDLIVADLGGPANLASADSITVVAGREVRIHGGGLQVQSSGSINLLGGRVAADRLVSRGTVRSSASGSQLVGDTQFPLGTILLDDADLELLGSASISNAVTIAGQDLGGTLIVGPGCVVETGTNVSFGVGSAGMDAPVGLTNRGTVRPAGAAATGVIHVSGEYFQPSEGTLGIDLGGILPSQYDRLTFESSAAVGGTLDLALINGYDPAYGLSHTILETVDGDAIFLHFDEVVGIEVSATKSLAVTYSPTAVLVTAALPGDANLDGTVNLQDFNALASNFGDGAAVWVEADFTGDGTVNLQDFNRLAANFGMSASPGGPTPQDWAALAAVVPEPAALGAITGACVLLTRNRLRIRS
jgi:hypothetical protein